MLIEWKLSQKIDNMWRITLRTVYMEIGRLYANKIIDG